MSPDDLRQQVELAVVELIKKKLADGSMTEERSQMISQNVLDTLQPGMSFEELYRALPRLDDAFPELSPVIVPHLREYEDHITQQAAGTVRELIKQGQYDAAIKLSKNVVDQRVNLVWQGRGQAS
ncbi:hypothetical protein HY947_02255 [Candidatus Gottesmanbacteria bacterium]|nr:hypothetical protein [Candidatus Gottesmanbacteria bacterium]